jgi:thiamine biosynthesis lipoprotein
MGGDAHVLVTHDDGHLLDRARHRVAELEARWSRFLPDSEISRLNRCPEQPVAVSPQTFALVEHAVAAWQATAGRYDPTVLPALRAAGYDRDLDLVVAAAMVADAAAPAADPALVGDLVAPGCALVELDRANQTIVLPAGVEVDPGGIGKGLAADLITAELVDAGAAGAMVNLGGDLRVRGTPPQGDAWSIAVEHPLDPERRLLTLGLEDGGVATSSRLRRRWMHEGAPQHHIIDPRTGRPAYSDLVAVTVVAAEAWWAEAAAKSVFIADVPVGQVGQVGQVDQVDPVDPIGALVVTLDADGRLDMSPELSRIAA